MAKLTIAAAMIALLKLLSMANMKPIEDTDVKGAENTIGDDDAAISKRTCLGPVEDYDETKSRGVESLSYQQMYDLLKYNRTDFVLLDVRRPQEHADGHIPASLLVTITDGVFEDHIDFRQIMCGRKFIVIYCRSGRRAAVAAEMTKKLVPTKLYPGSWIEWSKKNPENKVEQVRKREM